mmetsp:Transcript_40272/g.74394  ORF Transcript_40272/g.74394 Transcript_40272/m.74394 type:complete len:227 (-) Transcript_40272:115-795(-)
MSSSPLTKEARSEDDATKGSGGAVEGSGCGSGLLEVNTRFFLARQAAVIGGGGGGGGGSEPLPSSSPSLDSGRLGWFLAFGQVLGCALRTSVRLPLSLAPSVWGDLASALASAGGFRANVVELPVKQENENNKNNKNSTISGRSTGGGGIGTGGSGDGSFDQVFVVTTNAAAIRAMADGLCSVVPSPGLALFSGPDLEALLCLYPQATAAVHQMYGAQHSREKPGV